MVQAPVLHTVRTYWRHTDTGWPGLLIETLFNSALQRRLEYGPLSHPRRFPFPFFFFFFFLNHVLPCYHYRHCHHVSLGRKVGNVQFT